MSVNRGFWRGTAISVAMVLAQGVQARGWADIVTAPLVDPLLARPPELGVGKILPGDIEPFGCNDAGEMLAEPLTLARAVDLALCHNPQVQSAWASIKVQAAQVGEARAAYLPNIVAGVSRQKDKTRYPETGFEVRRESTNDAGYATLTWRLFDFGGRSANRRAANAWLAAVLASHDAALQKTMAAVIGLYFNAQAMHANRDARARSETLARQTMEVARKREARGVGAQSDTLQAATSLARAELEHARAAGTSDKAHVELGVALGLTASLAQAAQLQLAPDHDDAPPSLHRDLNEWLALAEDQHPAIVAARSELDAARERLTVTRSEGLPTLDFTSGFYINGRPNQSLSAVQSRETVFGISINIPLFDGFGRTYKVRGAEAQIEVKQAELRDKRLQVLGEVSKAYADASAAYRNLDSSRRLAEAAQGALDNVRKKYDRGLADILEMLNVQAAVADSESERIRALTEWRSARLRILANAGVLGLGDLQVAGPVYTGQRQDLSLTLPPAPHTPHPSTR